MIDDDYKDIFKQYTLDFIPVVNPEGYVYQSTMESNFNALIKSIRSIDKTKEMTEIIYNQLKNQEIDDNDFIEYGYDLIDSYIKDHI